MTATPSSHALLPHSARPPRPRIGVHVSIAGKLSQAIERAVAVGATTMQIFSRSPRAWAASRLDPGEVARFRDLRLQADLRPLAVHAAYLINLATRDGTLYRRSIAALRDELTRAAEVGADSVVVHVGSCPEEERANGLERVVRAVTDVLEQTEGVALLLENTAGERGDLGADLGELGEILDRIGAFPRLGVCLDTCHAFAAGYDFRTPAGAEAFAALLARTVGGTGPGGAGRLKLLHVNDSKKGLNCRVDRHEHIGQGYIGADGFRALFAQPICRGLPLILETPKDHPDADPRNLALVHRLWKMAGGSERGGQT